MKLKIDDYILVNNQKEFRLCQKYLFSLGFTWCDGSNVILNYIDDDFPDYILIETNHKDNTSEKLMFSYGHQWGFNFTIVEIDNIINFSDILKEIREQKLKRIT